MIASAAATAVRAVALGRATHRGRNAGSPLHLLHQEPPTLLLIKLELDRSDCFGRLGVGGLDRPEHFPGFANEHDAPAALHPGGELGRTVFLAGAACERALKSSPIVGVEFSPVLSCGLPPRAFPVGWDDTIAANASPLGGRESTVVTLGELMMILELHRQGLKVSAIARQLGIDRKTVRRYIPVAWSRRPMVRVRLGRGAPIASCRMCASGSQPFPG